MKNKLDKIEMLLKEIKKSSSPNKTPNVDIESIVDVVYERVVKKINTEGLRPKLMPPAYILAKFQEKEVKRWEEALSQLDSDELQIGAFVIALGKQTNRAEIVSKIFGRQYTSGEGYQKYSKKIDSLVGLEIFRTDKAKRIYPNLEEKVRAELQAYSPEEEKIQQTIDRIKRIFIAKLEES